ncbi:MAG: hypothetical protein DRN71_02510 [Candidatus Nanohalarchaeota archaeon]|nr:MAG: hypothetical protein DRN71_02510 [Candidatus Nanohaloarchaeota archaeon]
MAYGARNTDKILFDAGMEAFKGGDYSSACSNFQELYENSMGSDRCQEELFNEYGLGGIIKEMSPGSLLAGSYALLAAATKAA